MALRSKKIILLLVGCCLAWPSVLPAQEKAAVPVKENFQPDIVKEDFQLNIINKKVVEPEYAAMVEVAGVVAENPQVTVSIGAAVKTGSITLTLKNIFGTVHFSGSLEKILKSKKLPGPPPENH